MENKENLQKIQAALNKMILPEERDGGLSAEQLARFQSICLDEAEREGRERGRRITESGAMWEQRGAQKT